MCSAVHVCMIGEMDKWPSIINFPYAKVCMLPAVTENASFVPTLFLLAVWGIIGKCHLRNGTICIAITEKDFGIPIHTQSTHTQYTTPPVFPAAECNTEPGGQCGRGRKDFPAEQA